MGPQITQIAQIQERQEDKGEWGELKPQMVTGSMSLQKRKNERKRGLAADLRSLLGKLSLRSKLGACRPLSRHRV